MTKISRKLDSLFLKQENCPKVCVFRGSILRIDLTAKRGFHPPRSPGNGARAHNANTPERRETGHRRDAQVESGTRVHLGKVDAE